MADRHGLALLPGGLAGIAVTRVPEEVGFQAKPQLARVVLERAPDAEVPAS